MINVISAPLRAPVIWLLWRLYYLRPNISAPPLRSRVLDLSVCTCTLRYLIYTVMVQTLTHTEEGPYLPIFLLLLDVLSAHWDGNVKKTYLAPVIACLVLALTYNRSEEIRCLKQIEFKSSTV